MQVLSPLFPSLRRRYDCHSLLIRTKNVPTTTTTTTSSSWFLVHTDSSGTTRTIHHQSHSQSPSSSLTTIPITTYSRRFSQWNMYQPRRSLNSTAGSPSSSDNIQSQQRIKRFYKNVNVIEINYNNNNSTKSTNLVYPQLPPSQLVSSSSTSSLSVMNDSHDTTTRHQDTTTSTSTSESPWYTITLDGKQLRTPLGQVVMVPSMSLAHMIAIEWNTVTTHIIPNQMPMMTYVCTVLDQVMKHKVQYEQLCWQYVLTDTLGYPAHSIYEPILYQQQQKAWLPIKHWIYSSFCGGATNPTKFGGGGGGGDSPLWKLPTVLLPILQPSSPQNKNTITTTTNHKTNALLSSLSNNNNNTFVQKIQYDPELLLAIQQFISKLDVWYLLALYIGCKECKSFWLSCALLLSHTNHPPSSVSSRIHFTPEQIQTAARIEEEMNIADWGFVEGQHDYDRLNAAIQIRSIALYVQSLNETSGI